MNFSLPEQTKSAIIDSLNYTLNLEIPFETDADSLISTFALSSGASASVNGINQISGISVNDFTDTVTYLITAEDGSFQSWLVIVFVSIAVCRSAAAPSLAWIKWSQWTVEGTAVFALPACMN